MADASCTIFVASLVTYDRILHEDEDKNAMIEAIELFQELLKLVFVLCVFFYIWSIFIQYLLFFLFFFVEQHRYLRHSAVVLLLTKSDEFRAKIENRDESRHQLREWFDDYHGDDYNYDHALDFIKEKFLSTVEGDDSSGELDDMSEEMMTVKSKYVCSCHVINCVNREEVQVVFDDIMRVTVTHRLRITNLI